MCKTTWRNIRDKFVKAETRIKGKSGDGGSATTVPKLYNELSWMSPFVQHRPTETNMPNAEEVC